jgi:6-aminohexanoate-oligomer exohydrolase
MTIQRTVGQNHRCEVTDRPLRRSVDPPRAATARGRPVRTASTGRPCWSAVMRAIAWSIVSGRGRPGSLPVGPAYFVTWHSPSAVRLPPWSASGPGVATHPSPTAPGHGLCQGVDVAATRPEDLTADSWQEWPHNRWAYQHVDEVLDTADIPRGDGPVLALTRGEPLAVDGLDEALESSCTDGLLVLSGREVRLERYLNGMTPTSRHLLQSVSKSMTSAVLGQYVARGEIDVDAPVSRYVDALRGSAYDDATVQQTLDMTVAVAYDEAYADPRSELQTHDRASGWRAPHPGDPAGIREFLTTLGKDGEHGARFQYCSANTDVLAWILEEVSGRPFSELLSTDLWAPMGAEHDAMATVDAEGFVLASGGICVTLRDLARFGRMVLDGGVGADGRQVVPSGWVEDVRRGGAPGVDASAMPAGLPDGSYRDQFWVTGDEHGCFFGAGIYGQLVWMNPATDVVVAKLSTLPEADDDHAFERNRRLLHQLSLTD